MDFLERKKISVNKITAVASDGAASMEGRISGFTTRLKQNFP